MPARGTEVPVRYEYSTNLPQVLASLQISLLLSTYQAGKVITIGSHEGQLVFGFANFSQAMGLARTPTGLVVGSRQQVWTLPACREIAPRFEPAGSHDVAFLSRSAHVTGPVLGHELGWGGGRIWLVNTLFNCLCTLEMPWSFQPRWRPRFISEAGPGDRCHLNGLALEEDSGRPAYVTAHSQSDEENGWRTNKQESGCLIEVASNTVLAEGLCMPHSPRLYRGALWLLDSGHGRLCRCDRGSGVIEPLLSLPGFTRGMDCFAGHAVVGLSRIRESAVFGGLPIGEQPEALRCGVVIVDLEDGRPLAHLYFTSGIEEVFAVTVLPGLRNPVVVGPEPELDGLPMPWLVPPLPAEGDERQQPSAS